jgi:hypothetical protein
MRVCLARPFDVGRSEVGEWDVGRCRDESFPDCFSRLAASEIGRRDDGRDGLADRASG